MWPVPPPHKLEQSFATNNLITGNSYDIKCVRTLVVRHLIRAILKFSDIQVQNLILGNLNQSKLNFLNYNCRSLGRL